MTKNGSPIELPPRVLIPLHPVFQPLPGTFPVVVAPPFQVPSELIFGRIVACLRTSFGHTQQSMAQNVGVSQSSYARLEVGQVQPTYTHLWHLRNSFGSVGLAAGDLEQCTAVCEKDFRKGGASVQPGVISGFQIVPTPEVDRIVAPRVSQLMGEMRRRVEGVQQNPGF